VARSEAPISFAVRSAEESELGAALVFVADSNATEIRGHSRALRTGWKLTKREAEVLSALAAGHSNKEIAAALACAPRTIERHVSAILAKAKIESRARLVATFWRASTRIGE
jgi:DNA-binding NarL/FixJ family response regulator